MLTITMKGEDTLAAIGQFMKKFEPIELSVCWVGSKWSVEFNLETFFEDHEDQMVEGFMILFGPRFNQIRDIWSSTDRESEILDRIIDAIDPTLPEEILDQWFGEWARIADIWEKFETTDNK